MLFNVQKIMAHHEAPRYLSCLHPMLERMNEEFKRRTHIVHIFADEACCLRLIRVLAVEMHEEWIDANRYLNMELPRGCQESPKMRRDEQF